MRQVLVALVIARAVRSPNARIIEHRTVAHVERRLLTHVNRLELNLGPCAGRKEAAMDHLHPLWDEAARRDNPGLGLAVCRRNDATTGDNLEDPRYAVEDKV